MSEQNKQPKFDEIGPWSEIKLEIVKDYASEYSKILTKQGGLEHSYIDAFAGAGVARKKESDEYILGSPLNALLTSPPFKHYYFIDLDEKKSSWLSTVIGERDDVTIIPGDANDILKRKIFPLLTYRRYQRALCLLDPYGLDLNWEVVDFAGKLGTIELFINFPVLDMNRNVLPFNTERRQEAQVARMDAFWGDTGWQSIVYTKSPDLFGETHDHKFRTAKALVAAYRERLQRVAGFQYVPKPIPMKNEQGGVLYYLFFASPNKVGNKIVEYIFSKPRN